MEKQNPHRRRKASVPAMHARSARARYVTARSHWSFLFSSRHPRRLPSASESESVLPPTVVRPAQRQHLRSAERDRKSTRLNSSHANISYAVFCLKKKTITNHQNLFTSPARRGPVVLLVTTWRRTLSHSVSSSLTCVVSTCHAACQQAGRCRPATH